MELQKQVDEETIKIERMIQERKTKIMEITASVKKTMLSMNSICQSSISCICMPMEIEQ